MHFASFRFVPASSCHTCEGRGLDRVVIPAWVLCDISGRLPSTIWGLGIVMCGSSVDGEAWSI